MQKQGTLFFFCGKMGAGKSTQAKLVAEQNNGVLISEDDWLQVHYPNLIHTFDDYLHYSKLIKPFVRTHVQGILKTGTNVVLDFPANTVKQRAWFVSLCAEVNSEHEMIFINLSNEQCLTHISKRRIQQPERAAFDTEQVFRQVTQFFEHPTDDEAINVSYLLENG